MKRPFLKKGGGNLAYNGRNRPGATKTKKFRRFRKFRKWIIYLFKFLKLL